MSHYKSIRALLLVSTHSSVTVSKLLEDAVLMQSVVMRDGMMMREESHKVVSAQMEPKFQGGDLVLTVQRSGMTTSHTLKEYNFVSSGIQSVSDPAAHDKPNFRSFKTDSSVSSIPARAHFSKNGRVTGWFGFDDGIVELEFDHQTEKTISRLLQVTPPRLNMSFLIQTHTDLSPHKPYDKVWKVAQADGHYGAAYSTGAIVADASLGTQDVPDEENWAGTQWWGDAQSPCFMDDDRLWKMNIGVMVDRSGMEAYPNWQERISAQIAAASIMYEKQMNIELVVAWWLKYTSDGAAPELFKEGCSLWRKNNSLSDQLKAVTKILDNKGAGTTLTEAQVNNVVTAHLFTGCDNNAYGEVGLAGVGCIGKSCSGVNNLRSQWGTFAHELGHNLGGAHSFERGEGTTGGIMDYGDGKFGNSYQFNTDFRQCQICSVLTGLRLSNHEGFMPSCGSVAKADWDSVAKGCECQDDPAGGWGYPCAVISQSGWCNRYPVLKAACPVSCDLCSPGSNTPRRRRATPAAGTCCANNPALCDLPVTTFNPGPLSCSDMATYCTQDGFSVTLRQQCPKTCEHCPDPPAAPLPCDAGTSTQAPTTQAPTTQAPTTQAPTTQAATTQAATTKAPAAKAPAAQAPAAQAPAAQAPPAQAPPTQAPTTQAPTTQAPTTQSPTTQAPTTQAPTTQAPTTQAPTTQGPTTQGPSDTVSYNSIAPCVRHEDGCVSTGGYPDIQYGLNEGCEFTMPSLPLQVQGFDTEAGYDKLMVNGQYYSGNVTNAPGGIIPVGPLVWSSDGSEQRQGFKICPAGTGSGDCSDLDWRSKFGYSCSEMSGHLYCENGAQGSGWPTSWGSLDSWSASGGITVSQACCACGGGS